MKRVGQVRGSTTTADDVAVPSIGPLELVAAYHSRGRVSGRTHGLYRYPARFSPALVEAAVRSLSEPDDVILDPFVGGGTTAVESLALGRRFVGLDINPISTLLTRAKTTPLYARDVQELERWVTDSVTKPALASAPSDDRLRNAPDDIAQVLAPFVRAVESLRTPRQREAARAVLLDAAQRAIDGRQASLAGTEMPRLIRASLEGLVDGIRNLMESVRSDDRRPSGLIQRRVIRCGDTATLASSRGLNRLAGRARLVVTSPPYPGVHVLYHRWQVGGRAETPMPYWIADAQDGLGPKHYTMGGRSLLGVDDYFRRIEEAWSALRRLLARDAVVVQLVAFGDASVQMPRYLAAMTGAGYERAVDLEPAAWRDVPNRRWYYRVNPARETAREILLIHRIAPVRGADSC